MTNMVLWYTDIHLDYMGNVRAGYYFAKYIKEECPDIDGIILTGDIANGNTVSNYLEQMAEEFGVPIFCVLGNHDYHHSDFDTIDKKVNNIKHDNFHWLNNGFKSIKGFAICGVGGWYDASFGDINTKFMMPDFYDMIAFSNHINDRENILQISRKRAQKDADKLKEQLFEAVKYHDNIIVATHVPPYYESAWYKGKRSDKYAVPWFVSKATGDVIDEVASINKDKKFTVLCGHTHHPGIYHKDNITVATGKSIIKNPNMSGELFLDKKYMWSYNTSESRVEFDL